MDPELDRAGAGAARSVPKRKQLKIAAAESCTGGLAGRDPHRDPGSSDVLERGFVTYSNEAKQAMLGVPSTVLANVTARSAAKPPKPWPGAPWRTRQSISRSRSPALPGPAARPRQAGRARAFCRCVARRSADPRERRYGDIGRAQVRRASVIEALAMLGELAAQE